MSAREGLAPRTADTIVTGERDAASARLVIGYGNALRTDDGIGPAVAELVGARVPSIRCLAIPMLTPELAPQIADAACVVFVDARVGGEPGRLRVSRVRAGEDTALGPFGHLLSAGTLVALARGLYGRSAEAFQVSVDAGCLDVGAGMTPPVAAAVPRAADLVSALLES